MVRSFTGFLVAALCVGATPADSGSMMLMGVGAASSTPAWVGAVCPGMPTGGQCVDFVGNQWWDGITGTSAAATAAFTDTRAGTIPYDPGTSITTSVGANTLPIGSAGLQVFQVNNFLAATSGDYSNTGVWAQNGSGSGVTVPTVVKNPNFGGAGCTAADTAPDGSCNTTEITISLVPSTRGQSTLVQLTAGTLTAGNTYTCFLWAKNSAAVANPQTYISMQEGATPFAVFASALIQPGPTWQRFSVTGVLPATYTSLYFSIGSNNLVGSGSTFQALEIGGGTFEAWVSGCSPGPAPAPYLATTSAASPSIVLDNIVATGDLVTALASANAAVQVVTQMGGNGVAATMIDANGAVLVGKDATNHAVTGVGATLASKARGNFSAVEKSYFAWNGSGGQISLGGTTIASDATARTPPGAFHIGATSGTSAPLNGYIKSIAVYPTAVAPLLASSAPITGVSFGTIATLSSGTLQGSAPSTYVNGDSPIPTVDAAGNVWTFFDDAGYGSFTTSGVADANTMLAEVNAAGWHVGTPGWLNLGNATGGPPGLVNTFAPSPMGGNNTPVPATVHTWKSCGLLALTDGANTDLMGAITLQNQVTSQPWKFGNLQASIITAVASGAATTANWNGMPPYSGGPQPVVAPTFPTPTKFGAPCFIQYAPGYVNSGLPVANPDNSGSYVYAIGNDGGWNYGDNVYVGRIALSTFMTSLGGSLSAAVTAANWTYYNSAGCAGGDGTNSACWGALASATPIFTLTGKLARPAMTYLPTSNRYLLQSWIYPTYNGPTMNTIGLSSMALTSQFISIDCAKPWLCTSVVSTIDWPTQGYYGPAIVPPSLTADGGLTATVIFAGNFSSSGDITFTSTATYTPTMAQININY